MKKLATLKPGAFFFYGGVQWIVLESDEKIGATLALAAEPVFHRAFDEENRNDWRVSSLRRELNGPFLDALIQEGAKELPITDLRMTRFWISLTQGVELVIKALAEANGGETFISKIPSFKITDLAEAMLPGCQIRETGIRPGEKLHEIMVTTEDSATTYEYDKHFIVYPQMTWNNRQQPDLSGRKVEEGFHYSSDNNTEWIGVEEIRTLLKDVELEK